jgi:hypothetical protein
MSELSPILTEQKDKIQPSKPTAGDNDLEAQFKRLRASTTDLSVLTEELKHLHQSPEEYWYAMGSRLQKVLNHRLYRSGGYSSFSDYCSRGLGYSRQHIYKLIKVVHFIDDLWARAETPKQRQSVQRLFSLGFTKLYVLHTLPLSTIEHLLEQGVSINGNDGDLSFIPTLETVTISQLKRALAQDGGSQKVTSSTTPIKPSRLRALSTLIHMQARSLVRYLDQWRAETNNDELLKERLHTIEQYVSSIIQGIGALAGDVETNGGAEGIEPRATILMTGPEDESFNLIRTALSSIGVKVVTAPSVNEAGNGNPDKIDLVISRHSAV